MYEALIDITQDFATWTEAAFRSCNTGNRNRISRCTSRCFRPVPYIRTNFRLQPVARKDCGNQSPAAFAAGDSRRVAWLKTPAAVALRCLRLRLTEAGRIALHLHPAAVSSATDIVSTLRDQVSADLFWTASHCSVYYITQAIYRLQISSQVKRRALIQSSRRLAWIDGSRRDECRPVHNSWPRLLMLPKRWQLYYARRILTQPIRETHRRASRTNVAMRMRWVHTNAVGTRHPSTQYGKRVSSRVVECVLHRVYVSASFEKERERAGGSSHLSVAPLSSVWYTERARVALVTIKTPVLLKRLCRNSQVNGVFRAVIGRFQLWCFLVDL